MNQQSNDRKEIEEITDQFLERLRRGDRPAVSEYADRYPDFRSQLLRILPALEMIEELAPSEPECAASGDRAFSERHDWPAQQLGDYRILRQVGRGGMGVVYEAEQESLGRRVALKVLPANARLDARRLERFQREAKAAAMLHHTNIVPVFGVGDHHGLTYFVMQFIHGASLAEVLTELRRQRTDSHSARSDRRGSDEVALGSHDEVARPSVAARSKHPGIRSLPGAEELPSAPPAAEQAGDSQHRMPAGASAFHLPGGSSDSAISTEGSPYWHSVARIGVQVAGALQHAHEQGVLHRDIKPSNLLLDTRGVVWITDFGLAKSLDQEDLTQSGELVGTLRYMPPEQLSGTSDTRSDIYGLGLTLYELATLHAAYEQSSRQELLRAIADAQLVPPRRWDGKIPKDLETIILKAIAHDPGHRYRTAGQLASDLERFIVGQPIRARRVGIAERMLKWCRRRPAIAALSLTLVLAVGMLLVSLAWNWRVAVVNQRAITRQRNNLRELNRFFTDELLAAAAPETNPVGDNVTVVELLNRASSTLDRQFQDQPLVEASLRLTIGRTLRQLGRPGDADGHLVRANTLLRQHLATDHPDRLDAELELARLRQDQGEFATAESAMRHVLRTYGKIYGPSDSHTLTAESALARLLLAASRPDAEAMLSKALADHRRFLGPEHADTLSALNDWALFLKTQGRLKEAEGPYRRIYELRLRQNGKRHPYTLTAMNNLARLLHQRDKMDEAEDLLRELVALRRDVQGDDHPATLAAKNNLALWLKDAGRSEEAIAMMREVATGFARVHGPDHPHTLASQMSLALMYQAQGDDAQAELMFRQALEGFQSALGNKHPYTLTTLNNLGRLLRLQGRLDEAEPLFQTALDNCDGIWDAASPNRAYSEFGLGMVLLETDRLDRAEPLLLDAWRIWRKQWPKYWLTPYAQAAHAHAQARQGKLADAESTLRTCYEVLRADTEAPARRRRDVARWLAEACQRLGKTADAERWQALLD